jgi:hypothetical protein
MLLNAAAIIASKTNAQTVIWKMLVEALVIARMISVSKASVPMETREPNALTQQIASLICVATKVNVMIYVLMVKLVAHAE